MLTWRNLADLPSVEWIGKGNRPRRVVVGPAFVDSLSTWREPPTPTPPGCARHLPNRRHHPTPNRLGTALQARNELPPQDRHPTTPSRQDSATSPPTTYDEPPQASFTPPPTPTERTSSTSSTYRRSSATPTRRPPCAPTSTRWTPASSTAPQRSSTELPGPLSRCPTGCRAYQRATGSARLRRSARRWPRIASLDSPPDPSDKGRLSTPHLPARSLKQAHRGYPAAHPRKLLQPGNQRAIGATSALTRRPSGRSRSLLPVEEQGRTESMCEVLVPGVDFDGNGRRSLLHREHSS